MSEVVVSPVASGDDGYSNLAGGGNEFHSNEDYLQVGDIGTGNKRIMFIRFPAVAIAKSAKIASATLTVQAYSNQSSAVTVKIYCNDVDDATAPSTYAGVLALVKTTAYTEWVVPSMSIGVNYSVDISAPIQEVIDRAGWVSGNDLQLIIDHSLVGTYYREFESVDMAGGTEAVLTIDYSDNSSYTDILVPQFTISSTGFNTQGNAMPLPVLTVEATGTPGLGVTCTFPSMTINAHAEVAPTGSVDVTLPSFTVTAGISVHGSVDVSLPFWTVASRTGEGTSVTLPKAMLVATALHAFPGNAAATLPRFSCVSTGLVGEVGSGSITLPKFTSTGTAFDIPVGTFSSSLPGFTAYATGYSSDRFANYVLRYTR